MKLALILVFFFSTGILGQKDKPKNDRRKHKKEKDPVNCVVGEWAEWSGCDTYHMTQYRERRILKSPKFGGRRCPKTHEVIQCKPVHCAVEPWGEWSSCDPKGFKHRRRVKIHDPERGGKPCPHLFEQLRCHVIDCEVSVWGDWSKCKAGSDNVMIRARYILQSPKNGGLQCPPLQEEKKCLENTNNYSSGI